MISYIKYERAGNVVTPLRIERNFDGKWKTTRITEVKWSSLEFWTPEVGGEEAEELLTIHSTACLDNAMIATAVGLDGMQGPPLRGLGPWISKLAEWVNQAPLDS